MNIYENFRNERKIKTLYFYFKVRYEKYWT